MGSGERVHPCARMDEQEVHCHTMPQGGNGKSGDTYSQNALEETARSTGPYFDKSASKNVTALLGKTTYLNCRVKNLGNKTVSDTRTIVSVNRSVFAILYLSALLIRFFYLYLRQDRRDTILGDYS
ncbi:uncharacterized protein LOC115237461 [Formica exsecta]|uniref:uncharacterized protein LOC115237461 n=1 Tax=Formica exsecta TaxID=72781 RepID=UPI001142605E|nr:uncharacterized protein LOC115237461 [Formica exsecta]